MGILWRRCGRWLCFYAGLLAVCLGVLGLTGIENWRTTSAGCWLLLCFASLWVPDATWNKTLFRSLTR